MKQHPTWFHKKSFRYFLFNCESLYVLYVLHSYAYVLESSKLYENWISRAIASRDFVAKSEHLKQANHAMKNAWSNKNASCPFRVKCFVSSRQLQIASNCFSFGIDNAQKILLVTFKRLDKICKPNMKIHYSAGMMSSPQISLIGLMIWLE